MGDNRGFESNCSCALPVSEWVRAYSSLVELDLWPHPRCRGLHPDHWFSCLCTALPCRRGLAQLAWTSLASSMSLVVAAAKGMYATWRGVQEGG